MATGGKGGESRRVEFIPKGDGRHKRDVLVSPGGAVYGAIGHNGTHGGGPMQTKLETSLELLERVRAKHGASWYGLAALLDTHKNTVYNWKGGHTVVDRKFAPRIAALLEEPPEYVLLCLESEREPSPEIKKIWRRLAALIAPNAASILFGTVLVLGSAALPSQRVAATPAEGTSGAMYIKVNRRRTILRRFGRWLTALLTPYLSPARGHGFVTAPAV